MSATSELVDRRSSERHSLIFYLILMGLMILFPALLFAGVIMWQFTKDAREATEDRVVTITKERTKDIDRHFVEMITQLRLLARSPELNRPDLAALHERLRAALRGANRHIILADRDFSEKLNTRAPYGTRLGRIGDTETAKKAFSSQQAVVSNLFPGPIARQHVFDVIMPIQADGQAVSLLIMTQNAAAMVDMLRNERLPAGWTTTILDRKGVIVARSRDHDAFVGNPGRFPDLLNTRAETVHTKIVRTADDSEFLVSVARSGVSGWFVVTSAPMPIVTAPQQRLWLLFTAVAGILTGWSLFVVLVAARLVARPMREIAKLASALGRGEAVEIRRFFVRETDEIGHAVNLASRDLRAKILALRENEAHLRLATEAAELGTWERDLTTGEIKTSEAFRRMLGLGEEAIPRELDDLRVNVHPEDRQKIREGIQTLVQTGEPYELEYRVALPQQEERWVLSLGNLATDTQGGPARVVGVTLDITERKEREDRIAFLMQEMSHRAKNQLSVIQAMASQTARSSASLDEFQARFAERIKSLSRSNDLLVRESWLGASLGQLVQAQLSAFVEIDGPQLALSGEAFFLSAQATQTLGLALHELATNAAKYGAFSKPNGRVAISWRVQMRGTERRLIFKWAETGGPRVEAPTRRGFGSAVIERLVAQSFQADVELTFAEAGVRWSVDAPAETITGRASDKAEPL